MTSLPEPLPPETRTVGQLVAESIRFYGNHFWHALALGVGPAVAGVAVALVPGVVQLIVAVTLGSLLLSASYVAATALVAGIRPMRRQAALALLAGIVVLLPVPFLAGFLVLPAVLWLGLVGLVVPAVLIEDLGLRAALRRAVQLARADYVHAAGSLATLAIVGLLSTFVLAFLLRDQGETTLTVAAFLAVLVVTPLLFLGAALLYYDQAARVNTRPRH